MLAPNSSSASSGTALPGPVVMVSRAPAGATKVFTTGAPVVRNSVTVRFAADAPGLATRMNVWKANGPPTRPSASPHLRAVCVTPKALLASFQLDGVIGQY